ncbi:hypothetical protein [Streptomyces sp. NPDC004266]|uniref:hypothetical protein n=1 Tax=Streptomyces sp. NPDC004266 TaxID=3364693 RepID=UPI0036B1AA2C
MSSSQTPTSIPPHDREPEPPRPTYHHIATAGLFLLFTAYVMHEHPALRETLVAVGTVGGAVIAGLAYLHRR